MKKIISLVLSLLFLFNVLYFNIFTLKAKAISAKAYIAINADTGGVILGENINLKLSMASTTKIMTSLILAEQNTPDKTVLITDEMVKTEGTSMGLKSGYTVTYKDLLYGMLLSSGNDAANAAAIAISGSIKNFTVLMNKKAKALGMKNTNFDTPSGLDSDRHFSTCYDMAILTKEALKNNSFKNAVSLKQVTVCFKEPKITVTLKNHNKLLEYDYIKGVKTGFTKKSGRCLVSFAEKENKRVIAVTLKDPDDWKDHKELLDESLLKLYNYNISSEDLGIDNTVAVVNGNADRVEVKIPDINISLTNEERKNISYKINIKKILYAPVFKNNTVGSIDYYLNGKKVSAFNIKTVSDISKTNTSFFKIIIKNFLLLLG